MINERDDAPDQNYSDVKTSSEVIPQENEEKSSQDLSPEEAKSEEENAPQSESPTPEENPSTPAEAPVGKEEEPLVEAQEETPNPEPEPSPKTSLNTEEPSLETIQENIPSAPSPEESSIEEAKVEETTPEPSLEGTVDVPLSTEESPVAVEEVGTSTGEDGEATVEASKEEEPAPEDGSTQADVPAVPEANADTSSQEEEKSTAEEETKPEEAKKEEEGVPESEEAGSNEEPAADFSSYDKEELLNLIRNISEESDYSKFNPILREVKPLFDSMVKSERKQAREQFIADGGEPDSFSYQDDKVTEEFYKLYSEIQKQKHEQAAKAEAERENNLKKKESLLEQIRALTEKEESEASIEELKKLQEEWKTIGPVAPQHNRSLWASYNALMDLFYDKRSIYFELKELDRKKNLAMKLALCEKAEKLVEYESIKQSIQELNELHEEFKHIGPVPKDDQEALWQRFKTASDRVYDKKREFVRQREEEKQANYELKLKLCEEVKPYVEFQADNMKEWNAKTKEILELQKRWEEIRFIPRDKIKELSKDFWNPFKAFFNNKNAFIRTLDEEREGNLKLKEALCEEAQKIIEEGKDERSVADKLKSLQRKWKEIGPVPSKQRQVIYEKFKGICDGFFEKRRKRYAAQEKEYEENLKLKQTLCDKISQIQLDESFSPDMVLTFVEEWQNIGFVPKKDKKNIQKDFETAIDDLINRFPGLDRAGKESVQLKVELSLAKDSPFANKKVRQKEQAIRRKIQNIENDIDTLNNNIGFLASSKKANVLKDSLEAQIKEAQDELKGLRAQLKVFRNLPR